MLALVKTELGPQNFSLLDVPEPQPGPGQVKIKVEATGICGTDLHFWRGDGDQSMLHPPVVLGHEFSGYVSAVGAGVQHWKEGDYVTSEPPAITCQICEFCRKGMPALCPQRRSLGSGVNGAFTSYVLATDRFIHQIPSNIPPACATLSEPSAVCVHAARERGQISAGDLVLITGPGTIGLLMTQVAKAHGGYVILVGAPEDTQRLKLGRSLGADITQVAGQDEIQSMIKDISNERGVDIAFECSGAQPAAQLCLESLKKRGIYIQLGIFSREIYLHMNLLATKEINALGSFGSVGTDWDRALDLMSLGVIQISPLISLDLPLSDWRVAFDALESKSGCKAILRPEN